MSFHQRMGKYEFTKLLNVVNFPEKTKSLITDGLNTFTEMITKKKKQTSQQSTTLLTKLTNEEKVVAIDKKQETPPANTEKPLSPTKTTLADLEADYVEFKQTTINKINKSMNLLKENDNEIE